MRIAIHNSKGSFSDRWTTYCAQQEISYKIVNCYHTNLIEQLKECDALMWHHSQNNPKDLLIAKQILYSIEQSGKVVFPNFYTNWHFDDKLGQKYLLESIDVQYAKSFVFFNPKDAQEWANKTDYPVVFKLRRGAGSFNVKLINKKRAAKKVINKAFGYGFSNYDGLAALKEIIRKRMIKKVTNHDVIIGIAGLFISPRYVSVVGREKGYAYFQEFIPNNNFDIRVIVIGDKAFAIKRLVRKNDFRASGSGNILYERENFDEGTIRLAFEVSEKIKAQCIAFDFVYKNSKPLILEISYGFDPKGYESCPGYWDRNLKWIPGEFNPYGWMVDNVINEIGVTKNK